MANIPDQFEYEINGHTYEVYRVPAGTAINLDRPSQPVWACRVKGRDQGASYGYEVIPGETFDQLKARLERKLGSPR